MRLRNSIEALRRLQIRLNRTGHGAGDTYRAAMLQQFWEKLRIDKRIAKGEI